MASCSSILRTATEMTWLIALACGTGLSAKDDGKGDAAGEPTLKLTAEPVANIAGGKDTGATYAQQIELNLSPDLGQAVGVKGLSAHVTFVNRLGENVSERYVGDNLFQAQAVYGGTHAAAVHLVQAYIEEDAGAVDVAAGRLPVGEAFAKSPLYCQFLSTAICGYPHSLPAKEGFSAFPNSTWGARVRIKASGSTSIQAGTYQVRPKLGGKYGFDWGWSGTTGVYLPLELDYSPSVGGGSLPGHYKIGVAYDTSTYQDNLLDGTGHPYVLSGAPPSSRRSRYSAYVLADQMLQRHGDGERNGLIVMAGFVHSDPRTSQLANFGFVGVLDQGLIPGRPDDTAGLVLTYAEISDSLTQAQQLQSARGLRLSDEAAGVQTHEAVIEADYQLKFGPHFSVTPDVQYIVRPGATSAHRDALVAGARFTAQF